MADTAVQVHRDLKTGAWGILLGFARHDLEKTKETGMVIPIDLTQFGIPIVISALMADTAQEAADLIDVVLGSTAPWGGNARRD